MKERTREKKYNRYENYEEKLSRLETPKSAPMKDLIQHEEDLLVKEFRSEKVGEIEKMRLKRIRR